MRVAAKIGNVGLEVSSGQRLYVRRFFFSRCCVGSGGLQLPHPKSHGFGGFSPLALTLANLKVATARVLGQVTHDAPPIKFALLTSEDPAVRRHALEDRFSKLCLSSSLCEISPLRYVASAFRFCYVASTGSDVPAGTFVEPNRYAGKVIHFERA